MFPNSITDWRLYLRDGEQYLATAEGAAVRRREVFTPEILYNLTAMAIEKLIMGFLMSRGDLAENHTMGDLLVAIKRHLALPQSLVDGLTYLDSFQEICDLDTYSRRAPTEEECGQIIAIGADLKNFITASLTPRQA